MKICTRCSAKKALTEFKTRSSARDGRTSQCRSCLNEYERLRRQRHGARQSYDAMLYRCYNESHPAYDRYGGAGITVCDEWLAGFDNFLSDMGPRPEGHSLDRIDNGRGYTKDNCRWASEEEQQSNRKNNHWIEYNGARKTLSQWSRHLGIPVSTLSNRIKAGRGLEG